MLLMKPCCERCAHPLSLQDETAWICSYECTFCSACAAALSCRCPNCGGNLSPRPTRKPAPDAAGDEAATAPGEARPV